MVPKGIMMTRDAMRSAALQVDPKSRESVKSSSRLHTEREESRSFARSASLFFILQGRAQSDWDLQKKSQGTWRLNEYNECAASAAKPGNVLSQYNLTHMIGVEVF